MTTNALANLKFETTGDFIKFKADKQIKLRVLSTNPVISTQEFTNKETGEVSVSTKYAFAVWNYTEDKAMILNATPSIAQTIHKLHIDPDYDSDITKLDIKITPTGEMLERRYEVNVLPKAQILTKEQEAAVAELDGKIDSILKNGIRAEQFNKGEKQEPEFSESEVPPEDLPEDF